MRQNRPLYKKIRLFGALAAGTLLSALAGAPFFFYNFTLNKNSRVHMIRLRDRRESRRMKMNTAAPVTKEDQLWFASSAEEVCTESDDGLRLCASLFRHSGAGDRYVITCHGFSRQGASMAGYAKHFFKMGFHVLAPDARSHGKSEGTIMGMGWLDRKDILCWIRFLTQTSPNARIVLHGVSMGGAAVMMAAGEPLPANVRAIVEDCGYSSVHDEFKYQIRNMFRLPPFPFVNLTSLVSRARAGYAFKEASSVAQVKKSRTPILFIHGDRDTFVPYEMLYTLYRAASCEKELLSVKGACHAVSSATDPKLYWDTVRSFIERYL